MRGETYLIYFKFRQEDVDEMGITQHGSAFFVTMEPSVIVGKVNASDATHTINEKMKDRGFNNPSFRVVRS